MNSRSRGIRYESRIWEKCTNEITVSDLILQYLESEGVEYIFGISGAALNPFFGRF
jgi:hypothetical protein